MLHKDSFIIAPATFSLIKSLQAIFDDIDENIDPPKLRKLLPLDKIANRIRNATLNPGMIFNQD